MKRSFLSTAARLSAVLAASSTAAGVTALSAGPSVAHADPSFVSAKVGVGSDTIQDLFNAYAGVEPYSGSGAGVHSTYAPLATSPSTSTSTDFITVASFDAVPFGGNPSAPGTITTRLGGPAFDRPNGSSNGIKALDASAGFGYGNAAGNTYWQASTGDVTGPVNISGDVDFARASRGPDKPGTNLTFVPIARDGVTYAIFQQGGDTNNLSQLTTAQLAGIYTPGSAGGSNVVGTDTVEGCLPQSGSGTRSFWEGAIGVTDGNADAAATAAGCDGVQANVEENNANSFYAYASQHATAPGSGNGVAYIVPFSAGSWIAQANGAAADNSATGRSSGVVLGDPDGLGGGSPISGSGSNLAPNSSYYQSSRYGRDLFVVVPTNKVTGLSADKALQALFVNTATNGTNNAAICNTANQATANKFGFATLNSNDATTTAGGSQVDLLCGDKTDQAND